MTGTTRQQTLPACPAQSATTARVKHFALNGLGANLVGIANIERFEHAPVMMSPQGLMPSARSVIVMALHHPDACIELGGQRHPQEIGPYRVQYLMNSRLDEMSYRMALYIEDLGARAVPIVSSNIWRYKGYKELTEHFAPDLSHLHAAVAAGLAEFGYSGLAISPEYGARQRWVTVVTDAPLDPTPLVEPGAVCDSCMLCAKHCRSGALVKEIDGWNEVRIEDKVYRYARKNLWRCAWGEHFDLDLDLDIPERVDENVIREFVETHGFRGGEMGSCLRHCLPKALRVFDRQYSSAPRRRRHTSAPPELPMHRGLFERLRALGAEAALDGVFVFDADALKPLGLTASDYLPGGASVITYVATCLPRQKPADPGATPVEANGLRVAGDYLVQKAAYDAARLLEEAGYDAVPMTDLPEKALQGAIGNVPEGQELLTQTVVTTAKLPATEMQLKTVPSLTGATRTCASEALTRTDRNTPAVTDAAAKALLQAVRYEALEGGADRVGVAPASRLDAAAERLRPLFDGERNLVARDMSAKFRPFDPEIVETQRRVFAPCDTLAGARSVIVLAMRLPEATVANALVTPAEAVGPYSFAQYESINLLRLAARRVVRRLEASGYRAAWSLDLLGTGSLIANPRGAQPNAFCNRFAAVAAGLGRLTRCGQVADPQYGVRMRYIAIATDAELPADAMLHDNSIADACAACRQCLDACRVNAFSKEPVEVAVDGVTERFHKVDRLRCDWATRYSLVAEAGTGYLGWDVDIAPPNEITAETLAEALKQQPPIAKYRPCNVERCLLACWGRGATTDETQ